MILKTLFVLIIIAIAFQPTESQQHFKVSDLSNEVDLQWSFVSEIHHSWLQNIINTYFTQCDLHQQLKVLYNCNTTTQNYQQFWTQFIKGIEQIKFKQSYQQGNHQWSQMMIQAAQQWIIVNKTSPIIELQQAYEDIKDFPNNLMEFAQFSPQHQQIFEDMKQLIKWQRQKKSYMSKKSKDDQEMAKDQINMLKKYVDKTCYSIKQCTIPIQRYSYYLKDMFFYYFQQPQKYSQYDEQTKLVTIDPFLDYKITKLWRDMRQVMKMHLDLDKEITIQKIEQISVDILQSVMESLVKKNINKNNKQKSTNNQQQQEQNNQQL